MVPLLYLVLLQHCLCSTSPTFLCLPYEICSFCPVTPVLPVPLPLGHKRRGKVEQKVGVENKESVQEKEEKGCCQSE